jgi:hypothetical protein
MTNSTPAPARYVVKNDIALFPWLFMACWMSGLTAITWAAFRDVIFGGPVTFRWMPLILAVFWLAGIGFSVWAVRQRRWRVIFEGGRVEVVSRGPFSATRWQGTVRDVANVKLEEGTDSDGDPYFRCLMTIPGWEPIAIAEGHQRAEVEAVRDRVNAIRMAG